jgi:hypothetical protein
MLKIIKYWWKVLKSQMKISHARGSKELILFKSPYYPGQYAESKQSLSKSQWNRKS